VSEGRVRLGLIGEGIARSLAPRLHEHLGRLHGVPVTYELIDGRGVAGFDPYTTARRCAQEGFRGVNVTQPFKRIMRAHAQIADKAIAQIGSINTLLLNGSPAEAPQREAAGWTGTNTDYTGFLKAYRGRFHESPGTVVMAGAGGVGRAIAFALAALGAARISICDESETVARELADAVATATGTPVTALPLSALGDALEGATGIVNATPLGTHLRPGSAFPVQHLSGAQWAFDAVYTPVWTEFLLAARAGGVEVLTGFELFFHQGLDAFEAFTGQATDPKNVRAEVEGWVTNLQP
jgi:shikimate dehydrogenase